MLLARTDWDVPKHEGLSYFVIHMSQPGIEVRPLKQMNGHASFNEVFLTDAWVELDDLVGEHSQGWAVALTTLTHERSGFARMRATGPNADHRGRIHEEYAQELRVANEPYVWYPQRSGRVDLLLPRAHETGTIENPIMRQQIADVLALERCSQWFHDRGLDRGPAGSVTKLAASRADAILEGEDGPRVASLPKPCSPRQRFRSPAVPMRSSETSSRNGSWGCRRRLATTGAHSGTCPETERRTRSAPGTVVSGLPDCGVQ